MKKVLFSSKKIRNFSFSSLLVSLLCTVAPTPVAAQTAVANTAEGEQQTEKAVKKNKDQELEIVPKAESTLDKKAEISLPIQMERNTPLEPNVFDTEIKVQEKNLADTASQAQQVEVQPLSVQTPATTAPVDSNSVNVLSTATQNAVAPLTDKSDNEAAQKQENTKAIVEQTEKKQEEVVTSQTESNTENKESVESAKTNIVEAKTEAPTPIIATETEIVASRSVEIKKNQYLKVNYPGQGWVYLGETEPQQIMYYFGKKLGDNNTTFTLRSKNAGSTKLHFYKNDALTGRYIDDYLDITILDSTENNTEIVTAPSYADIVPAKPARKTQAQIAATEQKTVVVRDVREPEQKIQQTAKNEKKLEKKNQKVTQHEEVAAADNSIKTVIQTAEPEKQANKQKNNVKKSEAAKEMHLSGIEPQTDTELQKIFDAAQAAYKEAKFEDAFANIQDYIVYATERIDEALFLQGQILEAESELKNIRSAVDCYETLIKNFPQSAYWDQANKRSIYLKRFYIDIR